MMYTVGKEGKPTTASFNSKAEAEAAIVGIALVDPAGVNAGKYFIDAPDEVPLSRLLAILEAANGAILCWQVPSETRSAFELAADQKQIRYDSETDLYIHPLAIPAGDERPVQGWKMPEGVMRELAEAGFQIEGTGGGCTAWMKEFADGSYVMVTSDASHEIGPDDDYIVGVYSKDGESVCWGVATKVGDDFDRRNERGI